MVCYYDHALISSPFCVLRYEVLNKKYQKELSHKQRVEEDFMVSASCNISVVQQSQLPDHSHMISAHVPR